MSTGKNIILQKIAKHNKKFIIFKIHFLGTKWHQRRKILTPAFHFNVLQKYFTILKEHSEQIVRSLDNNGKEKVVELVPFLTYHTLSAICGKCKF